ncbi:MAG: serine O-acetyltransferase [Defluviitaleaceae bacterium]|nr:serine O-acetyltransferase [Defluviitaleaceae bacterium]
MGIRKQIETVRQHDPAMKSPLEIILYPSFWAVGFHRISHWLYKRKRYFLARFLSQKVRKHTGIEIHPGAKIGKCLFIDHGMGVVIGETCEIGDHVTIYQGVTLGGTGKEGGKRHPTIGDHVVISSGAKVLGPFKVGDRSKIGAGSVVLQEVPEDSTVVGIPGRVVRRAGEKVNPGDSLDQVRLPDPVSMEFCKLRNRIDELDKKIRELSNENL